MSSLPIESMFVHVTKACNLRCVYCYFSALDALPDEMTTDEFRRLWPDVVTVSPVKVIFTGGEPLLRDDITNLLQDLAEVDVDHKILRCINTNGQLLSATLARQMVGLVDEFRVSLDGLATSNDTLRGAGSFDRAITALDILYSAGFEPKIIVTVTNITLADMENFLTFLVRRQFRRFNINLMRPLGRGAIHSSWMPNRLSAQDSLERVFRSLGLDVEEHENISSYKRLSHCGVGRFLNLMPNGDVFPCHALMEPEFRLGNVRQMRLTEVCCFQGSLGAFQRLEFDRFSKDGAIHTAIASTGCLGEAYNKTSNSPLWKSTFPLNDIVPVHAIKLKLSS
jgi:MoaA/NifB/PqqE/SkfB family radical SAM enzyme